MFGLVTWCVWLNWDGLLFNSVGHLLWVIDVVIFWFGYCYVWVLALLVWLLSVLVVWRLLLWSVIVYVGFS